MEVPVTYSYCLRNLTWPHCYLILSSVDRGRLLRTLFYDCFIVSLDTVISRTLCNHVSDQSDSLFLCIPLLSHHLHLPLHTRSTLSWSQVHPPEALSGWSLIMSSLMMAMRYLPPLKSSLWLRDGSRR